MTIVTPISTAVCKTCEAPLRGRTDKKFCNDYCRNAYYNKIKATSNQSMERINYALKKNRKILLDLLQPAVLPLQQIQREDLLLLGFQFKYFTHIQVNDSGTCYYCYDTGYQPMPNDWYRIIHADNNYTGK